MLLRIVPPGWHVDVERAVAQSVDTVERVRDRYVKLEGPAPRPDEGETIVLVASPNDPLPDVIRRVTEALSKSRKVRVSTNEAA
jgi:hypothetical protein